MLAAILMAFFLGGAGVQGSVLTEPMLDDLDKRIEAEIVDPGRTERAAASIDGLRKDLKKFEKAFSESSETLTKLYEEHGADPASMRAELSTLDSKWGATQSRLLDHRFALKETLTREEWESLFGS
jgi:hypothetical protein